MLDRLQSDSGVQAQKKSAGQNRTWMKRLNSKALKQANNVLLWLWISAVSRDNNSTAELTLMWMYVALYRYGGARTATDRMFSVARYYDISPKSDHGDILSSTIKNRHIAHP